VKGRHGVKDKPVDHCHYFDRFIKQHKPPIENWIGKYSYPIQDMASVNASLVKYHRHRPDYDRATWVSAWHITEVLINQQLRGGSLRQYTLEEAQVMMDGSKATGWPFCHRYPTKQLAWDSPEFKEAYDIYVNALYSDKRVENFDTIFLKDEMRPLAKCGAGMARTVFCQDVVSATVGVQFGKHFDQRLIQNSQEAIMGNCAIAVGMSPFANTFQILTNKFNGFVCFELDGKAWDCGMFPEVHQENARIRCAAYGYDERTTKAVKNYYGQVAHTTSVLPDGSLQYRLSGNPSGQANTTIDNSMWTMSAFNYGIIATFSTYDIIVTAEWFHKNIRLIVFGDDIIAGLLESMLLEHRIDPVEFIERFQIIQNTDLGLVYTSSVPSPITDLNWLNCGWGFNRGRWWPILDGVKILNSLHVVRQQRTDRDTLERAISIRTIAYGNPILYHYVDKYVNWLVSQYGYFDLKSSILSNAEMYNLYTGAEVLAREQFDWEFDAEPKSLHKSQHAMMQSGIHSAKKVAPKKKKSGAAKRKAKKNKLLAKPARPYVGPPVQPWWVANHGDLPSGVLAHKYKPGTTATGWVRTTDSERKHMYKMQQKHDAKYAAINNKALKKLAPAKKAVVPTTPKPHSIAAARALATSREGISSPSMHTRPNRSIVRNHIQRDRIYIGALEGRVGLAPGQIMFSRRNRASYPGSYLQPLAAMYTRWRVRNQRYIIIPSVGSTFAGQILMAQDPDPVSTYNDDTTAIQSLSVLVGGSTKQAWEQNSCFMPHTKEHDNLFTQDVDTTVEDYTERFSCAGNLFVACVAVGDMASSSVTIGSIWLEYDYEFYEPRLQLNQLSDPSLINIFASAEFVTKMAAAAFGTPGPGIMQELMSYINVLDLGITTIQSLYDAVATFFSYLPYSFSATPAAPLQSKYLENGAGISPLEHPGYGPGNYALVYKIFMSAGLMNNVKDAFTFAHTAPVVGDHTQLHISDSWYFYDYENPAPAAFGTGIFRPSKWFGYTPQFSGVSVGTVYSYYNGNIITSAYDETASAEYVNIQQDVGGAYNDMDGKTYAGCWTFGINFFVNSRRGYADLALNVLDFLDATANTNIRNVLIAAAGTEDLVVNMNFTNKGSNVFTNDEATVRLPNNLAETKATKLMFPDKSVSEYKLTKCKDRVPDPVGDNDPPPLKSFGMHTRESKRVVRPKQVQSPLIANSSPIPSGVAIDQAQAKLLLDNLYMVQRAMADSDDDEKDEGSEVSATNSTSIKERRRQATAPGGRGIKLRSPTPQGREERDPPPAEAPKSKSQSNK